METRIVEDFYQRLMKRSPGDVIDPSTVKSSFLDALRAEAGDAWTAEMEEHWSSLFDIVMKRM